MAADKSVIKMEVNAPYLYDGAKETLANTSNMIARFEM